MTQGHDDQGELRLFSPRMVYSWALLILLVVALYLAWQIFSPFGHAIVLSIVLAAIFYPVHRRFSRMLGGRDILASLLVLLLIVVCIFIPTILFLAGLVTQGVESIAALNTWLRETDINALVQTGWLHSVAAWLNEHFPQYHFEDVDFRNTVLQVSRRTGEILLELGKDLLGNTVTLAFDFLVMILILFFLFKDGKRLLAGVKYFMPLREEQEDAILMSLKKVSRSVLVGSLLIALLQGIAGGLALSLVGVPGLFWGTMMGFASLVPVLGTALIWIPAVVYLLLVGQWQGAIFLGLWCGILVVGIDSVLRPIIMRGASGISTIFIFLSILGGLGAFGPIGILYGPLILSFAVAALNIVGLEYHEVLSRGKSKETREFGEGK